MKKQQLFDTMQKLVCDGMVMTGGFIRDFLIRGEEFLDIDFYALEKVRSKVTEGWDHAVQPQFVVFCKNNVWKKTIDGITINVIEKDLSYFNDVSCNRFGFDGEKIYLKKSTLSMCPVKSWEKIFKKEFMIGDGIFKSGDSRRVATKLFKRGWTWDGKWGGERKDFKNLEDHDPSGPWTDFREAKRRFDEFFS